MLWDHSGSPKTADDERLIISFPILFNMMLLLGIGPPPQRGLHESESYRSRPTDRDGPPNGLCPQGEICLYVGAREEAFCVVRLGVTEWTKRGRMCWRILCKVLCLVVLCVMKLTFPRKCRVDQFEIKTDALTLCAFIVWSDHGEKFTERISRRILKNEQ